MPSKLRKDGDPILPTPVPTTAGYSAEQSLGMVANGTTMPASVTPPENPNKQLIEQYTKMKADVDSYIETLSAPEEAEKVEQSRTIQSNGPDLVAAIYEHVTEYREKLSKLEAASKKYEVEKVALEQDRTKLNRLSAQVAAKALECGSKENECVKMKRENAQWQNKMKQKDGNTRLIRHLNSEMEMWKDKISKLEKSAEKYETEKKWVANMQTSMTKYENDLKVAQAAQRRVESEVKLLEAENQRLQVPEPAPYVPPPPPPPAPEPEYTPPPPSPPTDNKAAVEARIRELLKNNPIQFVQSEPTITEDGLQHLDLVANELSQLPPGAEIELHGHTFCRPQCMGRCGLVELSKKRCDAIVADLRASGRCQTCNFTTTAWGCKEPTIGSQKIVRFLIK